MESDSNSSAHIQQPPLVEPPPPAPDAASPASDQETIEGLMRRRSELDAELSGLALRQNRVAAIIILVVVALLVADVMIFAHRYYYTSRPRVLITWYATLLGRNEEIVLTLAYITNVLLVGLLIIAIAAVIYLFVFRRHVKSLLRENDKLDQELYRWRVRTPDGWRTYLQEELRRLSFVSSKLFIHSPARFGQIRRLARGVEENLTDTAPGALINAEFQINAIKKLIRAEEKEQADQISWRRLAIAIMLVYIILVLTSLIFPSVRIAVSSLWTQNVYVFGIPPLIVVWAAIGSLAAILYRFYTQNAPLRYDSEVRWLIARPIVGIIMGLLAYLALVAGLVLVTGDTNGSPNIQPEVALIVAFLAGFSDKFYTKVIDLLLYRTTGQDGSDKPSASDNAQP